MANMITYACHAISAGLTYRNYEKQGRKLYLKAYMSTSLGVKPTFVLFSLSVISVSGTSSSTSNIKTVFCLAAEDHLSITTIAFQSK